MESGPCVTQQLSRPVAEGELTLCGCLNLFYKVAESSSVLLAAVCQYGDGRD